MSDIFNVRDKVAVITGGSRGLGRALSLGLAERGAHVAVVSRKLDNCEEVAALARRHGVDAIAVSCHVGRWVEVERLADIAYDHFGRVDVLVNNAGIGPVSSSMLDIDEKLFDATMSLNFKGPFRLSCVVGARMKAAGSGSIVNISSGAATNARPGAPVYAAGKAALNAVTIALAIEYGPEVRVNTIGLGPTRTDVNKHWFGTEAFTASAQREMALQRGADPQEILGTVIYLASDASSFTTGAVLAVDGGMYGNLDTRGDGG
jgi:NAD(P)-dependent dehydrogenase (short-subunit alcohol dehydrogenase family)